MRIAQLVEGLDIGGLERMAVDLAIAHRNAGHESSIYALFSPGALAPEAEAAGVSVVPFHKKLGFSLKAIVQLAARLRHDRIQVLHTHNSVVHHYGVLAAHLVRVPAIVNTRHGTTLLHTRPVQETYRRMIASEVRRTSDQWNPLRIAFDRPHEADFPAALLALGWRDRIKVLRDMWRFILLYKEFSWGRQILRSALERPLFGGYSARRWL